MREKKQVSLKTISNNISKQYKANGSNKLMWKNRINKLEKDGKKKRQVNNPSKKEKRGKWIKISEPEYKNRWFLFDLKIYFIIFNDD
jgi:hypothetical protein